MPTWRRVHQLPGVFVCPEHCTALRTTGVPTKAQFHLIGCPAEPRAGEPIPALLGPRAAINVARNSDWLLRNLDPPTDRVVLRQGLYEMLNDAGWIEPNHEVRLDLQRAMVNILGADHLNKLGCSLDPDRRLDEWLSIVLGQRSLKHQPHPLRYLLVLAFLEKEAADFFPFLSRRRLFGHSEPV